MKFAVITAFALVALFSSCSRGPNPWVASANLAAGDHRYTLAYRGDTILTVVDHFDRNLVMQAPSNDKYHFRLSDGTNQVVALSLDGYRFLGVVQGRSVELRPGAEIVLQR